MKRMKTLLVCGALCAAMAASALTGCGSKKVDGTKEALVVNGESFNTGLMNFYFRYEQAEAYTMFTNYGLVGNAAFWDNMVSAEEEEEEVQTVSTGSSSATSASSASSAASSSASSASSDTKKDEKKKEQTYGEQFKDEVLTVIENSILLRQHAADYGISIDSDVRKNIDDAAKLMIIDNPDITEKLGCTEADIAQVIELLSYEHLMRDSIVADVDTNVTDEEAAQKTITYVRFNLIKVNDDGSTSELSDEEVEQKWENARQLIKDINASPDPATADMEALSEALDEDCYSSTYSYGDDETAMSEARIEAAASLSDGEIYAEPLQDGNGLYVIRMDKTFDREATDSHKEVIIDQRRDQLYNDTLEGWRNEAKVELKKPWKDITVTDADRYLKVSSSDEAAQTVTSDDLNASSEDADAESVSADSVSTESVSVEEIPAEEAGTDAGAETAE